jgi:hypothetical protein
MKKTFYLALIVAAFALAAVPLFSQTTETVQAAPARTAPPDQAAAPAPGAPPAQITPAASPAAQAPPVKPVQMRTELIKLLYIDYSTASNLLRAYSTTGKVSPPGGPNASLIVVTDTPEVVAKMLQVIKEYDVKPTEIQFSVQIVQGGEGETDDPLRNDPVIKDLRNVLKYKGFTLFDSTILRVIEGERAQAKVGPSAEYEIRIRPKYIKDAGGDIIQAGIEFRKEKVVTTFAPNTSAPIQTTGATDLITTTLMLKDGVKTVVGVSKSDSDRGLILSAKVTK